MKSIKRYIPELVYQEIKLLSFKNKEHLYIICDMIYRISIFRKEDTNYSNKYTDIPKHYFRDIIKDSKSLGDAFAILKSNKIIESDNVYSIVGGKALGYKFNDKFMSKLIGVDIKSKSLCKNIIINKNNRNNFINDEYKEYRDFFLGNFKIDYDKAFNYINNLYHEELNNITISSHLNSSLCGRNSNQDFLKQHNILINKYNHYFMSISAINDGELYFNKNITNNRIDTNLTSLKSELKQFIYPNNLYQIDIVNSQPFILSLLLNHSILTPPYVGGIQKEELEKYTRWTAGGVFYEMFSNEYTKYNNKELTRKEIKDIMFCIFYSKNGSYKKEKSVFKSIFPTIMDWIEKQKEDKHNELAIKLQQIESKICINIICKELNKKNINYYTIHDAWLINEQHIKETETVVIDCFYKNFNIRPTLDIKKIN